MRWINNYRVLLLVYLVSIKVHIFNAKWLWTSCCINIRRLSDAKKIGRCAYKQYFITFDKSGQKMCVEMAMMMENFQQKSKRATTPSCWGGPLKKCDAWLLALSIYNHEVNSRFLICYILFVLRIHRYFLRFSREYISK